MNTDFHVQYKPLIGNHVRLEPIRNSHIRGLFDIGQHADDWRHLPVPCFREIEHAQRWVEQAIALAKLGEQYTYTLIDPQHQIIMGSTRYMNIRARHRGLEIGYSWIGREFQQSAVNTETKLLLLKHAFDVLGAVRVELKTDSRNLRSQLAIERIGATKEGVLRNHMIAQNNYLRDSVMYSIIEEDWPELRLKLKQRLAR